MSIRQLSEAQNGDKVAIIKTNQGEVEIVLFPEAAPKAVENFITHAKNGYYNGIIFHRVIPNFMIQGGDPTGSGMGGASIFGSSFEDEFDIDFRNFRGALSMANAGPNTNGSQFFIVTADSVPADTIVQMRELGTDQGYPEDIIDAYEKLGGAYWLDFRHSVFGQVIKGMDVVDAINNVERDGADKPLEDIIIEEIEIKEV